MLEDVMDVYFMELKKMKDFRKRSKRKPKSEENGKGTSWYISAILKHQKVSSKMLWKEKTRTWVKTQWPH